jgi:hypothetical protein
MTRGKVLNLTRAQVASRAYMGLTTRVPVGGKWLPIAYRLKDVNGGSDPEAEHCAGISTGGAYGKGVPTADCIGFVLWCSGIDRMQPGYQGALGVWLNCVSLIADAEGEQRFCRTLRPGEEVRVGDWLVNPKHIGLIVRPDAGGNHLVMDCSPRYRKKSSDITSPAIGVWYAWAADCRVLRPLFYKEAA